jgi:hypothetical protein
LLQGAPTNSLDDTANIGFATIYDRPLEDLKDATGSLSINIDGGVAYRREPASSDVGILDYM